MTTIGIISDNHGDWTSSIAKALAGVDAIIHAGDIGPYQLISKMESIAPTTAVLGNTDGDMPVNQSEVVSIGEKKFFVQHILDPHEIEAPLRARLDYVKPDVVVFGHTHKPFCETIGDVLFLNPGSVTRPRGHFAPSYVRLVIKDQKINTKFIQL